jgi:hypothetical protein
MGFDFRRKLNEILTQCEVFLAVIGQDWLKKRGSKGKSRLENPEDYVRIEIEAALKREIPVIPVLVSGAVIPSANKLPPSIKDLVFRHGVTVRPDPDFHGDMNRLIKNLKRQIKELEEHRIR